MIIDTKVVVELFVLTGIIHMIDTLSYSVRLNSVKSGQFALSFSLFNLISLVSRTANVFQGPLVGSIVDKSINNSFDPIVYFRGVTLSATLGTLLGILLIPTFLNLFSKAVSRLEVTGSVPGIIIQALSINNIKRIAKGTKRPRRGMLQGIRYRNIPKRLILLSTVITGIYTIGVLAANYAAIFVPDNRLAVANSSGMINGIASILLTLFVDPKAAIITDEAYRGKRQYGDVKTLVVMLIASKFAGTLLGQLFFIPAAKIIASFYS